MVLVKFTTTSQMLALISTLSDAVENRQNLLEKNRT